MELEEELCPYEIDHLDDTIHHTTEFARFYERIDNLGKFTTKCLNRCVEEDESFEKKQADFFQFKESFVSKPAMQEKLTKLYNVWSEFYIINIESMKEIRNDTLTQTIDPETLKARKLRLTAGHHVFTEISRLFYLIQRPRLLAEELDAERISLKNTKHNMWISILNSFDITDQYEEKEDKDVEVETLQAQMHAMWGKPIQSYTQTEVVLLIFFLTQQLNAIPCDCILEYRSVFEETWIRAAVLMQEAHKGDILTDIKMRVSIDVDDLFIANRMFGTFVSFYMGEIMRRFFYYDLLSKRPMALTKEELPENIVNKVHAWIHSFIDSFADEAFIDMYVTNASDAYNFVGDEKWFKYAYPNEVFSRAACLAKFRPHLYRRYFSEERITKNLLMENVKSSHVARTYIFKAITNYIQMKTGNTDIKWDSAVVIHSDEIQMSAHVLEAKKRPLMLQVLSSYYCYYELNVYITDDLFEALGVWRIYKGFGYHTSSFQSTGPQYKTFAVMKIAGLKPEECALDMDAVNDIIHMYRNVPAIKVARESFLSMTLCGPFTFSIPKMGLVSNKDMEHIISTWWMPFLRTAFDYSKMIGIVPYYFKKSHPKSEHQVPIVPDMELGYITVYVSEKHEIEYRWYWNHGQQQSIEKSMLWIKTDHSPTRDGTIKSALASLLPQYRTILILQRSLEATASQRAKPTHILEYKPTGETARNDHLTTLNAKFGEQAAGMSKARQEQARQLDIRIRTAELFKQLSAVQQANSAQSTTQKLMWTDSNLDMIERDDPGFASRVVPLHPDFHVAQVAKAEIVADLDKHMSSFNMIAAACMDFAMELIQPTGSARTQNVKGSERFENERIKEALNFFSHIAKTALVIAYHKQFEEGMNEARDWVINRKGGDPNRIAELYPELDVVVDMSCTPMLQYEDLKDMWMDGILSKDDFAHHAFHMRSMPHDQINITEWPNKYPKELLLKPPTDKSTSKPKKKKAKTSSV